MNGSTFCAVSCPYERGIPAHDTLNDVINALDPDLFKSCFTNWVETLRDHDREIIAVDWQDRAPQPRALQGPRTAAYGLGLGDPPEARAWPTGDGRKIK